jgi:signal transduction histidine kinase
MSRAAHCSRARSGRHCLWVTPPGEERAIRGKTVEATVATRTSPDTSAGLGELLAGLGARRADVRKAVALARQSGAANNCAHAAPEAAAFALVAHVADVLARVALDHAWRRPDVRRLVRAIALATRLPVNTVRLELLARVARDPRVIELSPPVAIEIELSAYYSLAGVEDVSLWTKNGLERLDLVFHAGKKPGRRARDMAKRLLRGDTPQSRANAHGRVVLRWQRPDAALIFATRNENGTELASAAARETCGALALILEREALLARSASRERALVEGGERLLARLGFDLHDGPIQDVAALAGDIHLFRSQLDAILASGAGTTGLAGRVDDLDARVRAVDRSLRQMVHSLESPTVARRPLDEAVRGEVEAFTNQTDQDVDLVLRGDFSELTDSQRIAVLRIVQESLTNIREHSASTEVSVEVTATAEEISAEIRDNGRGFDVERTFVRAARAGRFGLVGMSERARLLGGRFDVRSSPGGPTSISLVLPAWRPATIEAPLVAAVEALRIG